MPAITLATVQSAISADVRENGTHLRELMRQASAGGARIVHFPEAALSGYVKSQIRDWDAVDWSAVEEELAETAMLAARLGLWVVAGCNHRLEPPDWPQNCLYIISDRGAVAARYAKRLCSHSEVTAWYTPGADPVTFEVDGLTFGCALCIEVCFPELFAEYERLGAHCMLLSSYSKDPMHAVMAQAHAATNCFWVSLSTPSACSARLPSRLIGPDGNEVLRCAAGQPDLVVGTLDTDSPAFEIPLRRARQWRAQAREGGIYACARAAR